MEVVAGASGPTSAMSVMAATRRLNMLGNVNHAAGDGLKEM
jgi:hypothetical protein